MFLYLTNTGNRFTQEIKQFLNSLLFISTHSSLWQHTKQGQPLFWSVFRRANSKTKHSFHRVTH